MLNAILMFLLIIIITISTLPIWFVLIWTRTFNIEMIKKLYYIWFHS